MTGLPKETFSQIGGGGPAGVATSGPSTASAPQQWFIDWSKGGDEAEGPAVNEWSALNYFAVYSCVSLISSAIASMPLITYRKTKRGRERATDRSEYQILRTEFNPNTSALCGRETGIAHLLTWGNSYAQIVKSRSGTTLLRLQPLSPDCVTPVMEKGALGYEVRECPGGKLLGTLPAREVLHVPGLGYDGLVGYSPVRVAKASIRTGMAQEQEAEKFVLRGVRPAGAIEFPKGERFEPGTTDAEEYRKRFARLHANRDSNLGVVILENGASWKAIGIDPESAQLLESRGLTAGQVCGLYRVPPHMIGLVEKVSSWGTGVEQQVGGFIKFCLLSWVSRIEQEYNRKLFGGSGDLYCEHLMEALERADLEKRTAAFKDQVLHGGRSPNEWREAENLDTYEGGDVFFYPLNVGRVDPETGEDIPTSAPERATPAEPSPPVIVPAPAPADERVTAALRKTLARGLAKCLRKEAAEATQAAKHPRDFQSKMDAFYARHSDQVEELFDTPLTAGFAERHLQRSKTELLAAAECQSADLAKRVERTVERWQTERVADFVADFGGLIHAV